MYLLDANVSREIGKPEQFGDANVRAWLKRVDETDIFMISLIIMENWKGVEKKRQTDPDLANNLEAQLNDLIESLGARLLPFDSSYAHEAGRLLSRINETRVVDLCLAATAKVLDMVVVTKDVRGFEGTGVKLLDPSSGNPQVRIMN